MSGELEKKVAELENELVVVNRKKNNEIYDLEVSINRLKKDKSTNDAQLSDLQKKFETHKLRMEKAERTVKSYEKSFGLDLKVGKGEMIRKLQKKIKLTQAVMKMKSDDLERMKVEQKQKREAQAKEARDKFRAAEEEWKKKVDETEKSWKEKMRLTVNSLKSEQGKKKKEHDDYVAKLQQTHANEIQVKDDQFNRSNHKWTEKLKENQLAHDQYISELVAQHEALVQQKDEEYTYMDSEWAGKLKQEQDDAKQRIAAHQKEMDELIAKERDVIEKRERDIKRKMRVKNVHFEKKAKEVGARDKVIQGKDDEIARLGARVKTQQTEIHRLNNRVEKEIEKARVDMKKQVAEMEEKMRDARLKNLEMRSEIKRLQRGGKDKKDKKKKKKREYPSGSRTPAGTRRRGFGEEIFGQDEEGNSSEEEEKKKSKKKERRKAPKLKPPKRRKAKSSEEEGEGEESSEEEQRSKKEKKKKKKKRSMSTTERIKRAQEKRRKKRKERGFS